MQIQPISSLQTGISYKNVDSRVLIMPAVCNYFNDFYSRMLSNTSESFSALSFHSCNFQSPGIKFQYQTRGTPSLSSTLVRHKMWIYVVFFFAETLQKRPQSIWTKKSCSCRKNDQFKFVEIHYIQNTSFGELFWRKEITVWLGRMHFICKGDELHFPWSFPLVTK